MLRLVKAYVRNLGHEVRIKFTSCSAPHGDVSGEAECLRARAPRRLLDFARDLGFELDLERIGSSLLRGSRRSDGNRWPSCFGAYALLCALGSQLFGSLHS